MKTVPDEPTEEMIDAMAYAISSTDMLHDRCTESPSDAARSAYQAMLSACPEPAAEAVSVTKQMENILDIQLREVESNPSDSYMRGLYNGILYVCCCVDKIDYQPYPKDTHPRAAGKESGANENNESVIRKSRTPETAPAGQGDAQHEWMVGLIKSHPDWITCAKCGVVKQHSGKNGLCKGVVKVELREATAQGATPLTDNAEKRSFWTGETGWTLARDLERRLVAEKAEREFDNAAWQRDCDRLKQAEQRLSQRPDQQEFMSLLVDTMNVCDQAFLELNHAYTEPGWFTKGEYGAHQQFRLWLDKGVAAVKALRAAAVALSKEGK